MSAALPSDTDPAVNLPPSTEPGPPTGGAADAAIGALAGQQAWLAALSEAQPLGVYFSDAQGRIGYCNPQLREILGLGDDAASLMDRDWIESLHPDDQQAVRLEWQGCLARHVDFDMAFRIHHPDGAVRHLRSVARPVFSPDGRLRGHVGSVEDVTERTLLRLRSEGLLNTVRAQFIVSVTDAEGRVVEANDAFCAVSGWRRDELLGRVHPLIHDPDQEGAVSERLWATIRAGRSWRGDISGNDRHGATYWLDSVIAPLHGADGRIERYVVICNDVTRRHQQAEALAQANERFSLATDSGGIGVWEYDIVTGDLLWDAWMCRLFGQPVDPAPRRYTDWRDQLHPEDCAAAERAIAQAMAAGQPLDTEFRVVWPDGTVRHLRATARVRLGPDGRACRVVGVNWDVTDLRRLSSDLAHRAAHDALTGLLNRTEFETRLQRLLRRVHEDGGQHALLYIDLDQFKLVNDTCGHAVGDQLLRQVGRLLAESVRGRDTLARLGGDEFGVLLENCSLEQALRVAHKVCERMEDFRFSHGERRFRVGTSIGLVPVDKRWDTIAAIQQAADTSCYAAKEAGRNRVHAWFDTDVAMRHRQGEMQWAARIEQALDEGRFELYVQRVVPLRGETTSAHAEVLLRMVLDDGSRVLPGAFLPAAERFNLVSRIDRWVLREALAWMERQPSLARLDLLCVNLSGQSLSDRAFHAWAAEQLAGVGPGVRGRLCLEITETAAVTNLADAQRFIVQVRAAGVKVALDDFGAGASSFGYLKSLSVDYLKIDGRFISDLSRDPLAEVAVRCFVDVAKVVGVRTVAEFVDNPAARERLTTLGVDFAQGFLIHRPAPLRELALSLRTLATAFPVAVLGPAPAASLGPAPAPASGGGAARLGR